MVKQNRNHLHTHSIQTIAVVVLLLIFAFSSLVLVSLGASVYERNVADMQGASAERTAYAYLTQKVRQGDVAGRMRVGSFPGREDVDALIFSREIREDIYETYLYAHDGSLCELTIRQSANASPDMGAAILPVDHFSITQDEQTKGLLHIELETTEDDLPVTQTLELYVRSME